MAGDTIDETASPGSGECESHVADRRPWLPLRAHDVQLYRACDALSESVIYAMVLFGPWAFGTTQDWSIRTMNLAGYALGLLLLPKVLIRWLKGYRASRWPNAPGFFNRTLAGLTVAILGYCLVSALNAHATYQLDSRSFEYHENIAWLPQTFDSISTWKAFWMYLGMACAFWAVRDWLLGKSSGEEVALWQADDGKGGDVCYPMPTRLRRLLWVLCLNGATLAIEGIVQRLANCPKLLFMVLPAIHQTADAQFGPYAYRANAAQYFNLLWPICLGFWWTLNRTAGRRRTRHHVLLVCGALMAVCPMVSTSRGGFIVAVGIAALAALLFLATHYLFTAHDGGSSRGKRRTTTCLVAFFAIALGLGLGLGWKALRPRMAHFDEGLMARESDYAWASKMAADYPVFGVGPGAYESVSELYLPPGTQTWWAQVHNDWLETRITFGWVGSCLIYAALAVVLLRSLARGGIHGGRRFMILTLLAVGGCLTHARFDFPFQVHSITFLFLVICAVLFCLSRRPG